MGITPSMTSAMFCVCMYTIALLSGVASLDCFLHRDKADTNYVRVIIFWGLDKCCLVHMASGNDFWLVKERERL